MSNTPEVQIGISPPLPPGMGGSATPAQQSTIPLSQASTIVFTTEVSSSTDFVVLEAFIMELFS